MGSLASLSGLIITRHPAEEPELIFSLHTTLLSWSVPAHVIILAGPSGEHCRDGMEDGKGEKLKKVLDLPLLLEEVRSLKHNGRKIVFTNGCFDLLHPGHIAYLQAARCMGDVLIVGLNSDRSVKELKGTARPILTAVERAFMLSGLESVSFITIFDESTPLNLIRSILPDVLVKGGDWGLSEIVGRKEVEDAGGKVVALPYEAGYSTSQIIERILKQNLNG